jgi:uncharacterized repeat protein (TIGR02543 family)
MFSIEGGKLTIINNGSSILTLDGAGISDNTQSLVRVNNSGNFLLDGGTLSGNTAAVQGGGVIVMGTAPFTMSGGEISGNTAPLGGGVTFTSTFTMSGDATVDQDNEVYLLSSAFISVTAPLNGGANNITSEDTAVGTKIVQLPGGAIESDYNDRFSLSPSMTGRKLSYNSTGPVLELAEAAVATVTVTGSTGSGSYTEGQTVTIEATVPAGKEFVNWTTESAGVTFVDENSPKTTFTMPPNNVTVTATYKEAPPTPTVPTTVPTTVPPTPGYSSEGNTNNAFRVIFSDGGSAVSVTTDLSYGSRITAPAAPVKEGRTFAGWYKDEACTRPGTSPKASPET